MKSRNLSSARALLLAALALAATAVEAQSGQVLAPTTGPIAGIQEASASRLAQPETTMILGATRAGTRVVAVGDRGLVLLSDDEGKTFRQATAVPTRATLCAVFFVDAKVGWAVGHWGVILHTSDGGENWALQRDDLGVDQPLFTVWFRNERSGIAAGLFSLLLVTDDGGRSWERLKLPQAPEAQRSDTNLFQIFPGAGGAVYMAGEQASVYRSEDFGRSWKVLPTGGKGTLWAGVTLEDGTVLVAGLRGKVLRSTDAGRHWVQVESGTQSSITSLTDLKGGKVLATALDGVYLQSEDSGRSFRALQRAEAVPLTAAVARSSGEPLMFSSAGVVRGP